MKFCIGMRAFRPLIRTKRHIGDFQIVLQHNFSTSEDTKLYDVVISGGGMVGTAMAASIGYIHICDVFTHMYFNVFYINICFFTIVIVH